MKDLKVYLKDIPHEGLDFSRQIEADRIELDDEDYKTLTPLSIKAHIEKAEEAVIADADVDGRYQFTCARCLETTQRDRHDRFRLLIDIEPATEYINLGEDIRQEMVINLSSSIPLCREDCKGLCPKCGVNLNTQECECQVSGQRSDVSGQQNLSTDR